MHISSLIRSPSWLYYKLWTQNNLFHASFSRQRKLHQFRLCMPTTVKAAGAELPNSHVCLSRSLWLPRTLSWAQPADPRAKSVWASAVQNLGTAGGTGEGYEQVQAHLGAEGWDGAKPWLLWDSAGGLCSRINAIFCSHELGWVLLLVVWPIALCHRVETSLSLLPQRLILPQAERGFPFRHLFSFSKPCLFSQRSLGDKLRIWWLSHTTTGVV